MKKLAWLGLLLALGASNGLAAPERVAAEFAAPRIPLYLETDNTGLLVDLHHLLMARANVAAKLKVLSTARALLVMESGQTDGFYPSWVPNAFKVEVLYSAPLMRVEFYIFTAAGAPAVASLSELAGKRVGLVDGYGLNLPLAEVPGLFVHHAVNSQALHNMLDSRRVDAVIMSKNEVMLMCDLKQLPMLSYNPEAMLAHRYLGYSFLNNAKGIKLQRQINAAIYQLQQSGALVQQFPSLQPFLQ